MYSMLKMREQKQRRVIMATSKLDSRLKFKKEWIYDPPPDLFSKFEVHNLAKLAIIELKAEHAVLKIHEEALEEAIEIYSQFIN